MPTCFPDMCFSLDGRLSGVDFDFYFAASDIFFGPYDLGVCVNAWCFESDFPSMSQGAAMLLAYQRSGRCCGRARGAAGAVPGARRSGSR